MTLTASLHKSYQPSAELVAREIAGEVVIVQLTGEMGQTADDLFTVNQTGREIWQRLDGTTTLDSIVDELLGCFSASRATIEADVLGFINELITRRMVTEIPEG